MDIHEMKARLRELAELRSEQEEQIESSLAETAGGRGLVGDVLARYDRATEANKTLAREQTALSEKIKDLRDDMTVRDDGARTSKVKMGRVLAKDESFSEMYSKRDHTEDLDRYLRAVATRDERTLQELRAQSVSIDSEGGYTAPSILSSTLWDLARNKTVARDAGVSFIPLQSGAGKDFTFAKVEQDAVPAWRLENTEMGSNQMVFGSENLKPKSLALIVKSSEEVLQDSNQDFGSVVVKAVTKAFAREIDRVIFNGDPSVDPNEPRGARNYVGIGETTGAGTPTWSTLSDVALAIRQKNYEPSAFVMSVRDDHTLAEQRIDQGGGAGTGVYLPPPSTLDGIARPSTNMIPTDLGAGSDESFIIGGDFSQLLVGVRLDLTVRPLKERYAEFGQIGWVFAYRMDTALMRTDALHKIEGVTA